MSQSHLPRTLKDLPFPIARSMPPYARLADKIGDILINLRELDEIIEDLRGSGRIRVDVSVTVGEFAQRMFAEATVLMRDLTE